ncbi:MAG: hypothetical protein ACI9XK_000760 [Granulosicoccus sp.]|jgi:hypothetical protein
MLKARSKVCSKHLHLGLETSVNTENIGVYSQRLESPVFSGTIHPDAEQMVDITVFLG